MPETQVPVHIDEILAAGRVKAQRKSFAGIGNNAPEHLELLERMREAITKGDIESIREIGIENNELKIPLHALRRAIAAALTFLAKPKEAC